MRFMSHEALAAGVFNSDYCSAIATMDAWKTQLTNGDAVLSLLLTRLESDFSGTLAKMRKPFNGVAIAPGLHCFGSSRSSDWLRKLVCSVLQETMQRRCAMFCLAMTAFGEQMPPKFVEEETPSLRKALLVTSGWNLSVCVMCCAGIAQVHVAPL